jgi:hypothetical protein
LISLLFLVQVFPLIRIKEIKQVQNLPDGVIERSAGHEDLERNGELLKFLENLGCS